MSIDSNLEWRVCRVCLQQPELEIYDIFSPDVNSDESIAIKIMNCGGIPINKTDGFPKIMCSNCMTELEIAHKFRNACREAYQLLSTFRFTINDQPKPPSSDPLPLLPVENPELTESKDVKKVKVEVDGSQEILEFVAMNNSVEEGKVEHNAYSEDEDVLNASDDEANTYDQKPLLDVTAIQEVYANAKAKESPGNTTFVRANYKVVSHTQFKDRLSLRHKRSVKKNESFICYLCGNIYNTKYKLNSHIKQHNREKAHECEICQKRFATSPQLSRHMNSHTGNRPFKCKTCPASFSDPSTCIKHQRIHTKERPFKCEECGKSFAYSNVLKVHTMIHTGEKPFTCEICGKKFSQRHHKKSHIQTHLTTKYKLKLENYVSGDEVDHLVVNDV